MKKHTRILALLLALCMALSLAACSGNSGSSGSSSASGKTVVIGCQTDLVTLDPGNMYEPYANMISYAAYDMLYRVKPGTMGDPEPSVATGYKVDESKKVYTFSACIAADVQIQMGIYIPLLERLWSVHHGGFSR